MISLFLSKDQRLLRAAQKGQDHVVRRMLQRGANPNVRNRRNETSLYLAAIGGHSTVVNTLAEAGADVNAANDANDNTPLIMAAACGHYEVVRVLLTKGANPNARLKTPSGLGASAIHSAAMFGDSRIIRLLLEAGADPTVSVNGRTPMSIARERGHTEVIKILQSVGSQFPSVKDSSQHATSPSGSVQSALLDGPVSVVGMLQEASKASRAAKGYVEAIRASWAELRTRATGPQKSLSLVQSEASKLDELISLPDTFVSHFDIDNCERLSHRIHHLN